MGLFFVTREVSTLVCLFTPGGGYPHLHYLHPIILPLGVPLSGLDGGPTPIRTGWEYPLPARTGWANLPSFRQSSIASTCYAAGGVPLAFTQGDFLVLFIYLVFFYSKKLRVCLHDQFNACSKNWPLCNLTKICYDRSS